MVPFQLTSKVGQVWCWVTGLGHDYLEVRERERIFRQCWHCGHATAGWVLEEKPRVTSPVRAWGRGDFKAAYQEAWEAELEVHGGG